MSGVLQRAAGFFLAPPTTAERPAAAMLPPAARAVVLGQAADTTALAAALALSLRAAVGASTALVAVWDPDARAERRAATRAASRLAARLTAHELPATARGRLAWLALASEPAVAAAAVRSASAIVEGPLVTALTGARPAELEDLVVEHDLAIVAAEPGSPLARAALARLSGRGVAGTACAPLRGVPRRLALAGLAAPRLDRAALATRRDEV